MTVHNTKPSVLKVKGGKYVTVRKGKDGMKLCAQDNQNELLVYIYTRQRQGKKQMAFCFHRADGCYVPKVGNVGITLELFASCNGPSESSSSEYWFEKIDIKAGEHYSLQSVGEPRQYLSLAGTFIVCCSEIEQCGQFTDNSTA